MLHFHCDHYIKHSHNLKTLDGVLIPEAQYVFTSESYKKRATIMAIHLTNQFIHELCDKQRIKFDNKSGRVV